MKSFKQRWQASAPYLAGISGALFLGRVIPELSASPWPLALVLGLNILLLLLALWLARRSHPHVCRWPWLLLLLYLVFPYPHPMLAAGVALLAATVLAIECTHRGTDAAIRPLRVPLGDGVLAAGFFALYLLTLNVDVLPADNGEFQLVAATWGVAHPPGYPLHTLLGGLLAQLPLGTVAWRVNLLSVLLAVATLMLVNWTVRRLTGRGWAGPAAALVLGTSTTFWAQATMSNVRTPTAFFAALGIYLLVRYQEALRTNQPVSRYLNLFIATLVLGLSHHLSLAFSGLVMGLFLLCIDPALLRQPRRWLYPALIGLLCLLPLLYLPLRAGAPLAPDNINSWPGLLQHVLALGFSGDFFYFHTLPDLWARLQVMANVFTVQFHPLVLLAGMVGAGLLLWKRRRLAWLLLGCFAVHTLITATYRAPQTVEYMLPAYVMLALVVGYGLGRLPCRWSALPLALLLLAGGVQGEQHLADYRTVAQDRDARAYAQPILDGAPSGAVVLADWHWAMPLRYLQLVEDLRPDLTIEYVAPAAEPYEETWARRISAYLATRPVVVTHYHALAYADLPVVLEPLGEAFLVRAEPRRALPPDFVPHELVFDDQLALRGYRLQSGRENTVTELTLAWSPLIDDLTATTLFVHLVGFDGTLYAQQDVVLDARFLAPGELALTRFVLEPRPGALPGRYSLQVGAYAPAGALPTAAGQARTELLPLDRVAGSQPRYSRRAGSHPLEGGLVLTGIDWDLTLPGQARLYLQWYAERDAAPTVITVVDGDRPISELSLPGLPAGSYQTTVHTFPLVPADAHLIVSSSFLGPWGQRMGSLSLPAPREREQYVPLGDGIVFLGAGDSLPDALLSDTVAPRLQFAASSPVKRDYVVSTSLIGFAPDNSWAWRELDDWVPAMGAIPTLKWIAGMRVTDPHTLVIPQQAEDGRVVGTCTLYDAFTGRQLPLLDERLAAAAPWIPLGEWWLAAGH